LCFNIAVKRQKNLKENVFFSKKDSEKFGLSWLNDGSTTLTLQVPRVPQQTKMSSVSGIGTGTGVRERSSWKICECIFSYP